MNTKTPEQQKKDDFLFMLGWMVVQTGMLIDDVESDLLDIDRDGEHVAAMMGLIQEKLNYAWHIRCHAERLQPDHPSYDDLGRQIPQWDPEHRLVEPFKKA